MNESEYNELLDKHYDSIIAYHERRKHAGKDYVNYRYTREEHHEFFSKGIREIVIPALKSRIYECDNDIDIRERWWIT